MQYTIATIETLQKGMLLKIVFLSFDSPMMCSSVLGALTLAMVLLEISIELYVMEGSERSLTIASFMEVMKSHNHLSRPSKSP